MAGGVIAAANLFGLRFDVRAGDGWGGASWERIVAAAGRVGIPFDPQQTRLTISGLGLEPLTIFANGMPTRYEERDAAAIFAQADILIHLNVGPGSGTDTVWTCDFTAEYVAINADYRT